MINKNNSYTDDEESTRVGNDSDVDIDNLTVDDIKKEALNNFTINELHENLKKYIRVDNLLKDKHKEARIIRKTIDDQINTLKDHKKSIEEFILLYLDNIQKDTIEINGHGKLVKKTSTKYGKINIDNVQNSIIKGLKENNIADDNKIIEIMKHIVTIIDKNKSVKTTTTIRRVLPRAKKDKSINNILPNNDDDLPKYK